MTRRLKPTVIAFSSAISAISAVEFLFSSPPSDGEGKLYACIAQWQPKRTMVQV